VAGQSCLWQFNGEVSELKHVTSLVEDATRDVRVFVPTTVCAHARHTQRATVLLTFRLYVRKEVLCLRCACTRPMKDDALFT
jgi:hypothetical protein